MPENFRSSVILNRQRMGTSPNVHHTAGAEIKRDGFIHNGTPFSDENDQNPHTCLSVNEPRHIMLCERSQTQKAVCCVILLM